MTNTQKEQDYAIQCVKAVTTEARAVMAKQLAAVKARNFEILPAFIERVSRTFVTGIMWKLGEQYELPTAPRDRAFVCLLYLLIEDGMSQKDAEREMRSVYSDTAIDNSIAKQTLEIAYEYGGHEEALATILEQHRTNPELAVAPFQLVNRAKPIAGLLSLAAAAVVLIAGGRWGVALGVGVVVGASVLGVAIILFYQARKKGA